MTHPGIDLSIPITTLLVDLDDTVYPASSGVWQQIQHRMETYMVEVMRIAPSDVPALRRELYLRYGTTLRGLQVTRHIDELEYLAYVHDVPLERLLAPDPALREVLKRYPQPKIIFTNADRAHARKVLRQVALEDCFDAIIDIHDIAPYCKPMPESFAIALRLAGVSDPRQCLFVDDGANNVAGARAAGLQAVRVSAAQPGEPGAWIHSLADLPSIFSPNGGTHA